MAGQMKLLSIVGRLTWLTIFVAGSVYAQNTVPTDNTKGAPPEAKQDNKPLQERPDTIYPMTKKETLEPPTPLTPSSVATLRVL